MKTSETKHHDRDTAVLQADMLKVDRNVGSIERDISILAGGSLVGLALLRRTLPTGIAGALVGGPLLMRGITGHCSMYRALGINTAMPYSKTRPDVLRGINVVKSIIVNRSVEETYRFWETFEKFPHFMKHVTSITPTGEKTSHWTARAPFGQSVEWDAEIVKTEKNELIEWRSLEGSEVVHAGSVRFEPVNDGRQCKVTVTLRYAPPAGIAGFAIAKLFGEEPGIQIEEDLRRFRQVLEAGEVPTTEGQPSGRLAA